jgi:outer membrane protein assembly factor BamA
MEKQGNLHIGKHVIMAFLLCFSLPLFAGEFNIALQDTTPTGAKVKTGWSFGALPAVSFNTDLGFQYGGLVNLYHFGDGSTYPKYRHSVYAEVSRYTKGSGINRLFYDSEYLIPNIRITSDLSYFTEKAIDFYGFNGYNSVYNPAWEDSDDPDYISRMFYRHERNMFRFIADFQGPMRGRELRWVAGLGILKNSVDDVDIESLNKGKKDEDLLPTNVPGLFDKYVEWGIIGENEKSGGWSNHLKLGVVYDTRDNEPNPWKGIWSEVVFFAAPSVFGNGDFGYSRVSATHRQYFTVVPNRLSFAYRLNFLGTLSGDVPFYMLPYQINSFSASSNTDGIGGSKTVRGMLRNRVVGDAMAFGNFEFRWRFYRTVLFNQNIYLALSTFSDLGKVLKELDFQRPTNMGDFPVEASIGDFFLTDKEELHVTYGAGFRIVMNENFIVAVDYGRPLDNRDGKGGLYIGLNFLF